MKSTKKNAKEQLAEIEARIQDLRTRRPAAVQRASEARDAWAGTDMSTESGEYATAREARRALGEIDDQLEQANEQQVRLLNQLSGRRSGSVDAPRSYAPGLPGGGWATAELLTDPAIQARLEEMSSSSMPVGRMALGQVADRDQLMASLGVERVAMGAADEITGTEFMRRADYIGVIPQLRRQFRILDLLPVGTTNGNLIPYTQEGGTFNAAETAEGDTKPEDGATYTDAEARVSTIAAWQKLRKQALADFAALQGMIDSRLRYGVELRLEGQILAGNGVGDNILGILNTTGIGSVPFDAATPVPELVLDGVVNCFLASAEANAIAMHPLDWKTALTQKAVMTEPVGAPSAGDQFGSTEYVGGGPFAVTPQLMWGVPLVPSVAVPQGKALVGDFARGAQLFIREGINVLLSDSDQDDFIRNRVTILAEMRAALAVYRLVAFQIVHLA